MENSILFSFFLYKFSLFTNPILLMLRCNLCRSRRRKKLLLRFPTFLLLRSLKKNEKLNLLKFSLILIFVNLSWDWLFIYCCELFWNTQTLFLFCWNRERSMEKNIQKKERKSIWKIILECNNEWKTLNIKMWDKVLIKLIITTSIQYEVCIKPYIYIKNVKDGMSIVSCLPWVIHRLIERRPNRCCSEFQKLLISFRTFAGLSTTSITTFISMVLSHFLYIDHAKCFQIFLLFWISFSSFPIRFRLPYGGETMSEAYRILSRWNMCEFIQLKKFSHLSERNKTIH